MNQTKNADKRTGTGIGPNDTFESDDDIGNRKVEKPSQFTPGEARRAAEERWKKRDAGTTEATKEQPK